MAGTGDGSGHVWNGVELRNLTMAVSPALAPMVAEQEKARRYLVAIASVLGRSNRIVTGEPVTLQVTDERNAPSHTGPETPGWTDGETIWLNGQVLSKAIIANGASAEMILALKGVNYHELAHVLFSPKSKQEIAQKIWREDASAGGQTRNLWYAFNVLEDLRAEMMFVTDYNTAIAYYSNMVAEWILRNPANTLDDMWPLLSGRYYLRPDLRRAARDAFAVKYGRSLADDVENIVRPYLRVVFPRDTNRALVAVRKFADLLNSIVPVGGTMLPPPSGTHHDPTAAGETGAGGGFKGESNEWRQKDTAPYRDEFLDELEDESDRELAGIGAGDDDDADDGESAEGEGYKPDLADFDDEDDGDFEGDLGEPIPGDEDGEGEGMGGGGEAENESNSDNASNGGSDGDSGAGDGDESGEGAATGSGGSSESIGTEGQSAPGEGDGQGAGAPSDGSVRGEARESLHDVAEEIRKSISGNTDVATDIDTTMNAVRREVNNEVKKVEGYEGNYHEQAATSSERAVVARLGKALKDLRIDFEPLWIREQNSGVIDIPRAMLAEPGELDVFQQWDEGSEEEASTEVVILLDQSSSMNSIMGAASKTMWTLKRALDEANITTTVIGYDDDWQVLYQPKDKAISGKVRIFPSQNNTYPVGALREASKIFRGSRASNHLLVSITDGIWFGGEVNDQAVEDIRYHGGKTVMVNIGHAPSYQIDENGAIVPLTVSQKRRGVIQMQHDDSKLCHHEIGYYMESIEDIVPIVGAFVADWMRDVSLMRSNS